MTQSPKSAPKQSFRGSYRLALVLAGLLIAAVASLSNLRLAAEGAQALPAPALDASAAQGATEVAVLAGGCFWGVQGVYQHLKGVTNAVSGYAGGDAKTASYASVTTGTTGHAESVQVTFDPRQISYGRILQIFYSVVHDPTQLNRQGPDIGTQYRSALFPKNFEQARIAKAYIAQLDSARVYKSAIVTKIEPDRGFYAAEDYHQDFMTKNPHHPYIVFNDAPKVQDLKRLFPALYREEPVLVAAARASH